MKIKIRKMTGKSCITSETRMYKNIMDFAVQLYEKQQYKKAADVYDLLLTEANYEKADAGFKESLYQYVCADDGERICGCQMVHK